MVVESGNHLTADPEKETNDTSDPENEAITEVCCGNSVIVTDNQQLENSVLLHQNMRENIENILSKGQSRKQREENKRRREHRMEYTNRKGKKKDGKKLQPFTCKNNCCVRISEAQHEMIFDQFYELSANKQDQFISGCIIEMGIKRKIEITENAKRN